MSNTFKYKELGLMIDCSRNSVMNITSLKKLIDVLSSLGYNSLQLYTEDTFTVENEPYFGYLRGKYTFDEIRETDAYAKDKGITLIPCIQTLAHLQKIFRWKPYWEINDCNDILLADDERTYALIDNIFASVSKCFSSKVIHIGMDEAHMLGLGKYKDIHGIVDRGEIMLKHLRRVLSIAEKYGFSCRMWSDMFFRLLNNGDYYSDNISSELKDKIPENLELVYWDYYSTDSDHYAKMLSSHKKISDNVSFAGGLWTWTGLVPHNAYGIKTAKTALEQCEKYNVDKVFFTAWGDDGGFCSPFSVLPAIFAVSQYAKGVYDEEIIKSAFYNKFGIRFDEFMKIDKPNEISEKNRADTVNPSKYLLYNDAFSGMFDSTVPDDCNKKYADCARSLQELTKNGEFGFVFAPVAALCKCLSYKSELGIMTRYAYGKGDKKALKGIIKKYYEPTVKEMENFYAEMKRYWEKLYKPNGFDVVDLRLGGVIKRLRHNVEVLNGYIKGKTDKIAELDEKTLDYLGNESFDKQPIAYNGFATGVTVNNI